MTFDPQPPTDLRPANPALAVNAKDAARILGISPRLLWTYTNCGEIPHLRLGRRLLYPLAALNAWIAAKTEGKSHG